MKNRLLKAIGVYLLIVMATYMAGCFHQVSFDLGEWNEVARDYCMLGFVLAVIAACSMYVMEDDDF